MLTIPMLFFEAGDIVLVGDDDGFSVLRLSRPQYRTTKLSFVHGHFLIEDEGTPCTYHNISQDEAKVRFGDLLREKGTVLVVGKEAFDVALQDGALAVTISQDLYHRILAACAEEKEEWLDHDFTEEVSDDDLDGDNSDQERAHESARLSSIGELPRNRIVRKIKAKMLDWYARRD